MPHTSTEFRISGPIEAGVPQTTGLRRMLAFSISVGVIALSLIGCIAGLLHRGVYKYDLNIAGYLEFKPKGQISDLHDVIDFRSFDEMALEKPNAALGYLKSKRDPAFNEVSASLELKSDQQSAIKSFEFLRRSISKIIPIQDEGEIKGNKYCLSRILQSRADFMGGYAPFPTYSSYLIVQSNNMVVYITELSESKAATRKCEVLENIMDKIEGKDRK